MSHELQFGDDRLRYVAGFDCDTAISELLTAELADFSSALLLVDSRASAHADRLLATMPDAPEIVTVPIEAGEHNKRLALVEKLLEHAVEQRIGRRSVVLAMGGGLIGNIAGMVAALLYRGLPLIHLPTTPVAAFDSVLSMKQAVNLPQGKNLCGMYLTPRLIACDLAWLLTVPDDQMAVGFAEMAKNVLAVVPHEADRLCTALAQREESPERTLTTLLDIGISAKSAYLAVDPRERDGALVFEYGHTVGHALEFAAPDVMPHGEAVAWGMLAAADLATSVCGLSDTDRIEHHRLFAALGVNRAKLSTVDLEVVKRLIRNDNKRGYLRSSSDDVAMVLLESLGTPATSLGKPLIPVPMSLVDSAIDRLREYQ